MITRFTSLEELKRIWFEILFNSTSKVTKATDQSILNGVAYGCAKIGQKAIKDIALVESHLFPEFAFGSHLDDIATRRGISDRFTASASSTYVRLVASEGVTYQAGVHFFTGNGVTFELVTDVTIGSAGYSYALVRSQSSGSKANVPANTITKVAPVPTGHSYVTNEFTALGGRDLEGDDTFRIRIMEGVNLAARGTLDYITQAFQKVNGDVLNVYSYGSDAQGRIKLAVSTQNGIALTETELDDLIVDAASYFNISDYNSITGNVTNVILENITYEYIDLSFRADVDLNKPIDEIRQEIQVAISKYLDWRLWQQGDRIEWDDILQIVKDNENIKYVSDTTFFPNEDIIIPIGKLPRIRGFILMDLSGNILEDNAGNINPVFYPSQADFSFQQTVLSDL
tara:strand:- start:73007 stop:74203 length:1197 start_codon:yes stop_codon:yes gene_type:complete